MVPILLHNVPQNGQVMTNALDDDAEQQFTEKYIAVFDFLPNLAILKLEVG